MNTDTKLVETGVEFNALNITSKYILHLMKTHTLSLSLSLSVLKSPTNRS